MQIIINAVFPTLVLLTLGNVLRRTHFLPSDFWTVADKLTYFVLFPALLITKVSQVDLSSVNFLQVFAFITLYFIILSGIALVIYRLFSTQANQLSSIYQGILRFNSYIFFALTESLWGQDTLSLAALFAGITIPIVNVCCVTTFSVGSGRFSLSKTLKPIVKNPLIISALLGFIINLFPVLLPQALFNSLDILSKAALPLALLSVGAAVQIQMLLRKNDSFSLSGLWLTNVASLLLSPLVALLLVGVLGIDGDLRHIMVLFAAVPTATSSYILSKQLGGNADMMATVISLQTVCSLLTLMLWLLILL